MRDCSSCDRKPVPGTPYHLTPCASCAAWRPTDDRPSSQRPQWWLQNQESDAFSYPDRGDDAYATEPT